MYVPAREQSMCKGPEAPESVVHEQKEISVTGSRQQGKECARWDIRIRRQGLQDS